MFLLLFFHKLVHIILNCYSIIWVRVKGSFLKVKECTKGSSNASINFIFISSRLPLVSVCYLLHAKESGKANVSFEMEKLFQIIGKA